MPRLNAARDNASAKILVAGCPRKRAETDHLALQTGWLCRRSGWRARFGHHRVVQRQGIAQSGALRGGRLKRDKQATEAARFRDPRSFVWKDGREQLVGLDWKMRKENLRQRAWDLGLDEVRCEYRNSDGVRCRSEAADPHHIVKRSVHRDDRMSNLLAVCHFHHELLDNRKVRSDRAERRANALDK